MGYIPHSNISDILVELAAGQSHVFALSTPLTKGRYISPDSTHPSVIFSRNESQVRIDAAAGDANRFCAPLRYVKANGGFRHMKMAASQSLHAIRNAADEQNNDRSAT